MTKENFKMFEIPLPPTTNTCRVPDIKDDLRGKAFQPNISIFILFE